MRPKGDVTAFELPIIRIFFGNGNIVTEIPSQCSQQHIIFPEIACLNRRTKLDPQRFAMWYLKSQL